MIHDQLAAAGAGIELKSLAAFGHHDYLRVFVYGVSRLPGQPALHADDLWRPPGPAAPIIRPAIVDQPAVLFRYLAMDA